MTCPRPRVSQVTRAAGTGAHISRCPGPHAPASARHSARAQRKRHLNPLMGQGQVLHPETHSSYPPPQLPPQSSWERKERPVRSGKEREALPSPTVHSAEHGAVAVAEAEAVEGPLPADHYGQAPRAVREARFSHPGHLPLLPQPPGSCSGKPILGRPSDGLQRFNL